MLSPPNERTDFNQIRYAFIQGVPKYATELQGVTPWSEIVYVEYTLKKKLTLQKIVYSRHFQNMHNKVPVFGTLVKTLIKYMYTKFEMSNLFPII